MAKVSGGMKKDWISVVRRDNATGRLVEAAGKDAMQQAENSMQLEAAVLGTGFRYFYGSAELNGRQGKTIVIWPTNQMSMDDTDNLTDSALAAGAITAEEAKRRRR